MKRVLFAVALIAGISQASAAEPTTRTTRSKVTSREVREPVEAASAESPVVDPTGADAGAGSVSSAYETESSTTYTQSAADRAPQAEATAADGDTGTAFAGKQMFVAPKLGVLMPIDLTGYNTQFTWGGELGFRASEKTTVGLSVLTSSGDIAGADLDITPIMLKLSVYPTLGNGFFIGPQAGMVKESSSTRTSPLGTSDTQFGAGLVLGYDYEITPVFSAGVEINHVTVFGDPDIYHLVNFVAPVKFHF